MDYISSLNPSKNEEKTSRYIINNNPININNNLNNKSNLDNNNISGEVDLDFEFESLLDDLKNLNKKLDITSVPGLNKENKIVLNKDNLTVPNRLNRLSSADQIISATIEKMRSDFTQEDLILVDSVLDAQKLLRRSTKIAKTVEEQWTRVLHDSYKGKIKFDGEEHDIDLESWKEAIVIFIDKIQDSDIRKPNYLIKVMISKSVQRRKNKDKIREPIMTTTGNAGYKDAGYTTREEWDKMTFDESDIDPDYDYDGFFETKRNY